MSELTPPPLFVDTLVYSRGVVRQIYLKILIKAFFKKWWGVKFAQITYVVRHRTLADCRKLCAHLKCLVP